jgi:hypothetical protein
MEKGKRDTLDTISFIFCLFLFVWMICSWLEVVGHNRTDCQYSALNMWVLVQKFCNVVGGA